MADSSFGASGSKSDTLSYYGTALINAYTQPNGLHLVAIKSPTFEFITWDAEYDPVSTSNRLRFEYAARSMFFNPNQGIQVFDGAAIDATGKFNQLVDRISFASAVGPTPAAGETITGSVSLATGTVVTEVGAADGFIYFVITSGIFNNGEVITATGGWSATTNSEVQISYAVSQVTSHFPVDSVVTGIDTGWHGIVETNVENITVASVLSDILVLRDVHGSPNASETILNTTDRAWGQPRAAGNPQGLNITYTQDALPGPGPWMDSDSAVAYRFTIASKDAFGRLIEGPPSGRVTVKNSPMVIPIGDMARNGSGTALVTSFGHGLHVGDVVTLSPGEANFPAGQYAVTLVPNVNVFEFALVGASATSTIEETFTATRENTLTLWLPVDNPGDPITNANYLKVYRSPESTTADIAPSVELFQCYESPFLTDTDISNGYFTFTDVTPEGALPLDKPLYTNPNSGNGILDSNYQPPIALDIAYFSNRMWYANTTDKHRVQISLIGTDAPDGIQAGDYFAIRPALQVEENPFVTTGYLLLTAVAEGTVPINDQFVVYTSGDPGFNIERTAQSLCQAINISNDNEMLYAYYLSNDETAPGLFLLQAREFGTEHGFTVFSDRGTAFTPQLTAVSDVLTTTYTINSDDNRHPAGLYYSKLGQPEAVPLLNFQGTDAANLAHPAGSDNDAILRIFPLNYRLIIFKTDGIYFCTNAIPFTLQKMSEYRLTAPDSLALLDDRIYALTDQGVVVVSDSGVQQISVPIDDALTKLGGPTSLTNLKQRSIGVAYRSARQYILWVIGATENNVGEMVYTSDNAQAFVYSKLSGGFTRYTFGARSAAIDTVNDKLIVAPTNDNEIWAENKTFTTSDYIDLVAATGTVVAISGDVLTVTENVGVTVGDVIVNENSRYLVSAVSAPGVSPKTITTLGATTWAVSDAYTVYQAIPTTVTFNDLTGGEPAVMKMSQQCSFLFRKNGVWDTVSQFASEINPDQLQVELFSDAWGSFAWGEIPYGGVPKRINRIQPLPVGAGDCCQLSVGFTTRQAFAKFEFLGIDAVTRPDTEANRG